VRLGKVVLTKNIKLSNETLLKRTCSFW